MKLNHTNLWIYGTIISVADPFGSAIFSGYQTVKKIYIRVLLLKISIFWYKSVPKHVLHFYLWSQYRYPCLCNYLPNKKLSEKKFTFRRIREQHHCDQFPEPQQNVKIVSFCFRVGDSPQPSTDLICSGWLSFFTIGEKTADCSEAGTSGANIIL